jgi:hypothetical protein
MFDTATPRVTPICTELTLVDKTSAAEERSIEQAIMQHDHITKSGCVEAYKTAKIRNRRTEQMLRRATI